MFVVVCVYFVFIQIDDDDGNPKRKLIIISIIPVSVYADVVVVASSSSSIILNEYRNRFCSRANNRGASRDKRNSSSALQHTAADEK